MITRSTFTPAPVVRPVKVATPTRPSSVNEEAAAEAPVVVEERAPRTTYAPEPNDDVKPEETEEPGPSDPIVDASDD